MVNTFSTRLQHVLLIVGLLFSLTSGEYWKSTTKNIHQKFKSKPNCNPHNYTLMLNTPNLCKEGVYLLILVRSIPGNELRRKIIRRTWGSLKKVKDKLVRVAFLFGNNTEESNKYIQDEHGEHRDVIQESFPESYKTLDLKTVMAWKWTVTYCPHAVFVIVCNDEIFVDIFKTVSYLKSLTETQYYDNVYTCWMEREGHYPNRNVKHKHGVSLKDYPGKQYPAFCNGNGYIASQKIIRKLYNMSLDTPSFMPDDVWTGVLSAKLGLLIINDHDRISVNQNDRFMPDYNTFLQYSSLRVLFFPLDRLPNKCEECVADHLWPKIMQYNNLFMKFEHPPKQIYVDKYFVLFFVSFIINIVTLMHRYTLRKNTIVGFIIISTIFFCVVSLKLPSE